MTSNAQSSNSNPLVTIVTVTYNAGPWLPETIRSVQEQTFQDYEHVFVDGKSTDNTLDIIQQQAPHAKCVSEPDRGIYDAMNKGASLAKGEWIIFMNAGDAFYDPNVLKLVFGDSSPNLEDYDFIYGGVVANFGDYQVNYRPAPLDSMWRGSPFRHQSLFARTRLLLKRPFDLQFRICADHDFVYYYYKRGHKFKRFESMLSIGDFTRSSVAECFWDIRSETITITDRHEPSWWIRLRLRLQVFRTIAVKQLIPKKLVRQIRSRRNTHLPKMRHEAS